MTHCIKTGAIVYLTQYNEICYGDLFTFGDTMLLRSVHRTRDFGRAKVVNLVMDEIAHMFTDGFDPNLKFGDTQDKHTIVALTKHCKDFDYVGRTIANYMGYDISMKDAE